MDETRVLWGLILDGIVCPHAIGCGNCAPRQPWRMRGTKFRRIKSMSFSLIRLKPLSLNNKMFFVVVVDCAKMLALVVTKELLD